MDAAAATEVVIVGASSDRSRFSNKAVRAYVEEGFTVYPVHPTETRIEGLPAFRSVGDTPGRPKLLLLYVRPEIGMMVVEEAAKRGIETVYVNPGTGSPELVKKIRALGLSPIEACAIRALGKSPAQYPD
jgi:predicted CoA-binding protein